MDNEMDEYLQISEVSEPYQVGKILYKDETYAIQGAIFEVYKTMGAGFL